MYRILKPFSFERFARAVQKATDLIQLETSAAAYSPANEKPGNSPYLLVNSEHKVIKVKHEDIRYIEAMREYVAYHTHSQGRILSLMSLKNGKQIYPIHLLSASINPTLSTSTPWVPWKGTWYTSRRISFQSEQVLKKP